MANLLLTVRKCWQCLYNKLSVIDFPGARNPIELMGLTPQSSYTYRVQSSVWRLSNFWPPPTPSPSSECVLPPHQRRGYTLAGRSGGGGSIFWKTPDIGLASYSIIPLWATPMLERRRHKEGITHGQRLTKELHTFLLSFKITRTPRPSATPLYS